MADHNLARALYQKLITLYPQPFREQFGESMLQTFDDLCHERQAQPGRVPFGFFLWLFVETAIGMVKEHILSFKEWNAMQQFLLNLRPAAIISLLVVLPFAVLEVINRETFRPTGQERFPFLLFSVLWLGMLAFVAILRPTIHTLRAGNGVLTQPRKLLLSVAALALIAAVWGGILVDQLPCLLGVPNCD
jgi:hypothetical protein